LIFTLSDFSELHVWQGLYQKAEPYLLRAVAIAEAQPTASASLLTNALERLLRARFSEPSSQAMRSARRQFSATRAGRLKRC